MARGAGFHHEMESMLGGNIFILSRPDRSATAKQAAAAHGCAGPHSHGIRQIVGIVSSSFRDNSREPFQIEGKFLEFFLPFPDFRPRL